jgi:hypothetical protein
LRKVGAILMSLVVGSMAAGCSPNLRDRPERSFSLTNEARSARIVRRCGEIDNCKSPRKGSTVQPGDSFDFDLYADESRAYLVSDSYGKTLGCVEIDIADGTQRYLPNSLSDARMAMCPPGTPKTLQ